MNDNPPSLMHYLEAYVCENAKAGQVRRHQFASVFGISPCKSLMMIKYLYNLYSGALRIKSETHFIPTLTCTPEKHIFLHYKTSVRLLLLPFLAESETSH